MNKVVFDNKESVDKKVKHLKKAFATHKSKDISYRKRQLETLRASLIAYEADMDKANNLDLGQSPFISYYLNTSNILAEIDTLILHLEEWSGPRYTETPAKFMPGSSYLQPEPYGVVLIMGAWNFNFQLSLTPLATAIAAGNVCLLKPSEMAPSSDWVMEKICESLDPDVVQVCHGERETCEALLANQFDFIFFTGSPFRGKFVAKAAAEFLTPCILELGGQNPSIIDKSAHIECATINIINGRFLNAGQVCLSPEYLFIEECIIDKVVESLKEQVKKLFGSPKTSEDYGRVINEFHTNRLSDRINNPGKGAIKLCGGDFDLKERYVEPAIFRFDNMEDMKNSNLAKEEIFGPILYLVPYKKLSDCIDYINNGDKPLVMYYFGSDKNNLSQLIKYTSSGGVLTNDTIVHFTNEYLPFGGVGVSGYGAYHGKFGFDGLSHLKPVMDRKPQVLGMRYPPYKGNENMMRLIIRYVTFNQSTAIKFLLFVLLLVVAFFFRSRLFSAGRGFVNGFLFE